MSYDFDIKHYYLLIMCRQPHAVPESYLRRPMVEVLQRATDSDDALRTGTDIMPATTQSEVDLFLLKMFKPLSSRVGP